MHSAPSKLLPTGTMYCTAAHTQEYVLFTLPMFSSSHTLTYTHSFLDIFSTTVRSQKSLPDIHVHSEMAQSKQNLLDDFVAITPCAVSLSTVHRSDLHLPNFNLIYVILSLYTKPCCVHQYVPLIPIDR